MNIATAPIRARGLVSAAWLAQNLPSRWVRILDVRGASARDDRSGVRLRRAEEDDPPRFVERGPNGGWLRAGTWSHALHPPAIFLEGHVPGSTSFDVGRRLFDSTGVLVSAPELAMVMSESGVGDEHTVVLVDNGVPTAALVAAWALERYGHGDTFILDGGFPRWAAERLPITRTLVKHPFASFTARAPFSGASEAGPRYPRPS